MSRGTWRLRAPILGVLAALAIGGCAESGPAGTPASTTATATPAARAKVFVPLIASTSGARSGSCWTSSITVGSASAYRCLAGHDILDPCFAAAATSLVVACYADPWTPGVRVDLAGPLPRITPLHVTHPWALELANGKRCVAATGVATRVGNLTLLYRCRGGGATGLPSPHAGYTEVDYLPARAKVAVPVPVTVIWQA